MYKVLLALYLPPRPGATFNFIKKLVKVTLGLCLSPARLSVWSCFYSKSVGGLCSGSSTRGCRARRWPQSSHPMGGQSGHRDMTRGVTLCSGEDTGSVLGGGKGKKKSLSKKPLRIGTYSSISTAHTDTKRHRHGDTERHPEPPVAQQTHWGTARCARTHGGTRGPGDPDTQTHTQVCQSQPAPLSNRRQLSFLCLP